MFKFISLMIVLGAMSIYNPVAEAQHGGGHGGGGGGGGGHGGGGGGGGGGHPGGGGGGGHPGGGGGGGHPGEGGGGGGGGGGGHPGEGGGGGGGGGGGHPPSGGSGSGHHGGVSVPFVDHSHVNISTENGRNGTQTVTYRDHRSGRTVLSEQYSSNRNEMTRSFYDRGGRTHQDFHYNRYGFFNEWFFYVYEPIFIFSGMFDYYDPFCPLDVYSDYWLYNWGWAGQPWYGYYGYYFHPYAHYRYPSEWLVDYYWSSLLSDDYQADIDDGAPQTPVVVNQAQIDAQQALMDQIKAQLKIQADDELTARSEGYTLTIDSKLQDPAHLYVVSSSMSINTVESAEATCSLSAGDVLMLAPEGVDASDGTATMLIRSSKIGDCKVGDKVVMSIEELAEFENEFNRRLDLGAEKMKADPITAAILKSIVPTEGTVVIAHPEGTMNSESGTDGDEVEADLLRSVRLP